MVYDYVMGEATVHLTLGAKKKFGHFVCDATVARAGSDALEVVDEVGRRECSCRVLVGGRESEKIGRECARLLRVCRRMYVFLLALPSHYPLCNPFAAHFTNILSKTHLLHKLTLT